VKINVAGEFATKNVLKRATGLSRSYFDQLEKEGRIEVVYSGNTAMIYVPSLERALEQEFEMRKGGGNGKALL